MSNEKNEEQETNSVVDAPVSVPVAEGSTVQPEQPGQASSDTDNSEVPSDAEQVELLQQTPNSELDVDPSIPQPSQDPTEVVESDVVEE